jgi:hypothetical protein
MTGPDRTALIKQLDETRTKFEELLPRVDPGKEIYPGWTIKDILAHVSGWDDATIDSLRSHVAGRSPETPAKIGIDQYNLLSIQTRADADYEHVFNEWKLNRHILHTILEQMPEGKFNEPLIVPWGPLKTVGYLVDLFREHEEEHVQDIIEWLAHPERPLAKGGN